MSSNRTAFLDMIAYAEGTSTSRATQDRGYDVIVTGADGKPEIFTSYDKHPFASGRRAKVINSKGLLSTAAGRYQELVANWFAYRDRLELPDFGPTSQDAMAIQQISEAGALQLIDDGHFAAAVAKCAHLWASLPGAGYDQPERELSKLQQVYVDAGGDIA